MNISQEFLSAAGLHQANRLSEAEAGYRKVLAAQSDHAEAMHFLGVLTAQQGNVNDGIRLIQKSLTLSPKNVQALSNLGRLFADNGQWDKSIECYHRAALLSPDSPLLHFALGVAYRSAGKLDEALQSFKKVAQLDSYNGAAYSEIGNIHRIQKRYGDAIIAHNRAVSLGANNPDFHNNRGNTLRDKGDLKDAVDAYAQAIRINPNVLVFHENMANALSTSEQYPEALMAFEYALGLQPDSGSLYAGLGLALAMLHREEESLKAHAQSLTLAPDDPRVHELYGQSLIVFRDLSGAKKHFEKAVELKPDLDTAWNGLGGAERSLGDFKAAAAHFTRALELNPDSSIYDKNLSSVSKQSEVSPEKVEKLRAVLNDQKLSADDRVPAGFALGKIFDDADSFDDAFPIYQQANQLYRQSQAAKGDRFDLDELKRTVDESIRIFTPEFFKNRPAGSSSDRPVFVVGMPRSGTTLIEQIAASHHDVFGVGELRDIGQIGVELSPAKLISASASQLSDGAKAYLARLDSLNTTARRIVDKMPGNIFQLGLIATLFPNARIIHACRDPRDNCLSCYFQLFVKNHLIFAYDLVDCANQFLETERLWQHWKKVLPLPILELQYEELVADLEPQAQRLIDFMGLDWDPNCLEFYKTQRTVITASVWQVRQPIYSSSSGRWKKYEKHLAPLLNTLGM